jgi:hypothetical protein
MKKSGNACNLTGILFLQQFKNCLVATYMKTKIFLAAAGMLLAISCSYSQQQTAPSQKAQPMKTSTCVVELFTSEGCSSCPSADALMPKLKEQYGDALIVLSFHVDYWDRLGWKDVFSKPEWTRRQNEYTAALNTDNIYTPQAVVDGKNHITGSNRSVLEELIEKGLGAQQPTVIMLSAKKEGSNITVAYDAPLQRDETLNIALVQHHATTNVRRGENGGRVLQHYNVVRDFKSLEAGNDSLSFKLPDGLTAANVSVIAFVQHKGDMHISAAKEVSIE